MFYNFNAHKVKKQDTADTLTDRLARKVADRIQSFQQGWAGFMDRHANKLPKKWLKAILIALVLGAGAYYTHLISGGVFFQQVAQIRQFKLTDFNPLNLLGDAEARKRNAAWDHYLDSLESQGKRDSLQNPLNYKP